MPAETHAGIGQKPVGQREHEDDQAVRRQLVDEQDRFTDALERFDAAASSRCCGRWRSS